jgi:hypothetical protein
MCEFLKYINKNFKILPLEWYLKFLCFIFDTFSFLTLEIVDILKRI